MHAQTLLTWGMNGADLPVPFGGPPRLRVPRQLGYKSVKFIDRIVVTDSLDHFGDDTGQSATAQGREPMAESLALGLVLGIATRLESGGSSGR